jgi:hypothetical protein
MNPLARTARYLTSSALPGLTIGAGIGAAAAQTREGESRGSAMVRGAIRGGAAGAAVGGAGRAFRDTRLLNPALSAAQAVPATAGRIAQGVTNFGRRQAHGFTGKYNPDAIGMAGKVTANKKIVLSDLRTADEARHLTGDAAQRRVAAGTREVAGHARDGEIGQRFQDAGITSLPGAVRALRDPGRRNLALNAMGRSMVQGGPALTLGLPVAAAAPGLARGDERAYGGQSTGQKVKGLARNIAMGGVTGGLPVIPQIVAGGALDYGVSRLSGER